MKFASLLPLAFMMSALAAPAHATFAEDAEVQSVMEKAVDEVIRPTYWSFHDEAEDMTDAMTALCGDGSKVNLDAAQGAFNDLVASWSAAEVLRDGPAIRDNRFERILFFPDRKGIGLKQVQALLATKDEEAVRPETMPQKSVALQGLGALEFILFGTGFEELSTRSNGYRCRAGLAIAENVTSLAQELVSAWDAPDGIQNDWKKPGPGNPVFRDSEEALSGLLGILVRGVETIRDKRIAPFYDPEKGYENSKKAVYWRSANTLPSIASNLESLQAYWQKSGMQHIIKGDASAITTNITFDFKTAISTAKSFQVPVADIMTDDKLRSKFDFLILTIEDLQTRLNNDYGRAMGLGASFTFSDGD